MLISHCLPTRIFLPFLVPSWEKSAFSFLVVFFKPKQWAFYLAFWHPFTWIKTVFPQRDSLCNNDIKAVVLLNDFGNVIFYRDDVLVYFIWTLNKLNRLFCIYTDGERNVCVFVFEHVCRGNNYSPGACGPTCGSGPSVVPVNIFPWENNPRVPESLITLWWNHPGGGSSAAELIWEH